MLFAFSDPLMIAHGMQNKIWNLHFDGHLSLPTQDHPTSPF